MKFLVTGLPRMRSAWLAALFSSDSVQTIHEMELVGLDEFRRMSGTVGVFDPSAPILYPDEHFDYRVVVKRESSASQRAMERWFGCPMPRWREIERALSHFEDRYAPEVVEYESLDVYEAVSLLHYRCTGIALSRQRFNLFDTLKIEQHREKAEMHYTRTLPGIFRRIQELRN